MKRRVHFSYFCLIITVAVEASFLLVLLLEDVPKWAYCLSGNILIMINFFGLFYAPLSVRLTDTAVEVMCSLRIKTIPLTDIKEVVSFSPTMGARVIRLLGSGGFMGYWGWFRERDLGKYFAYHGKASDCFLVVLKDDRKYMLGCKDAPEMVAAIHEKIQTA